MKTIVLAGDKACEEQILTTIKSLFYYNQQLKIYLLHQGLSDTWFQQLEPLAQALDSEIHGIELDQDELAEIWPDLASQAAHSSLAYARCLIPRWIPEDRVLYLDSDIIAHGDLAPLFSLDMQGRKLAAVRDAGGTGFEAGVLLIDNAGWKAAGLEELWLNTAEDQSAEAAGGQGAALQDVQALLNQTFQQEWLELDKIYNLQVGHDLVAFYSGWSEHFNLSAEPVLIHYTTDRKPWNSQVSYRYRDLWADFQALSLSEIRAHHEEGFELKSLWDQAPLHCLTLTSVQELEQIAYLVQALPEVVFHIASYTEMGPLLQELQRFDNVRLHPQAVDAVLDELISRCQVLLDISYHTELYQIVSRFQALGKPVLAFDRTAKHPADEWICPAGQPQLLVDKIRELEERQRVLTDFSVLDLAATLDYIDAHQPSVVRYGDGEMDLMTGRSIPYQDYDPDLAARLRDIAGLPSSPQLLVCQSDVFERLERYQPAAQHFWRQHLDRHLADYQAILQAPWYGSTFISRPYMDLVDKRPSQAYFARLQQLWQDKDLLIVEGETSRSGVGNDLFSGARSIKRIICPSRNAYSRLEDIKDAVRQHGAQRLILVMLGPTAKLLVHDLAAEGCRAIDLGHIDSEYEWFCMGATDKVKLAHKHTAEHNFDQDIHFVEDPAYESQILTRLTNIS